MTLYSFWIQAFLFPVLTGMFASGAVEWMKLHRRFPFRMRFAWGYRVTTVCLCILGNALLNYIAHYSYGITSVLILSVAFLPTAYGTSTVVFSHIFKFFYERK